IFVGILILGCERSEPTASDVVRLATDDIARGALRRAVLRIDERLAAIDPKRIDSPDAWTLKLLAADAQISDGAIKAAEAILNTEIPASLQALRARQMYLRGRLLLERGQRADALAALDEAERSGIADVALDVGILRGRIELQSKKFSEGEVTLSGIAAKA